MCQKIDREWLEREYYGLGYRKGKEDEHRWWSKHCANCTDADRPTGSWKEDHKGGGFKEWLDITCSLCGKTLHDIQKLPEDYEYCPFCGARMKGADDEV